MTSLPKVWLFQIEVDILIAAGFSLATMKTIKRTDLLHKSNALIAEIRNECQQSCWSKLSYWTNIGPTAVKWSLAQDLTLVANDLQTRASNQFIQLTTCVHGNTSVTVWMRKPRCDFEYYGNY